MDEIEEYEQPALTEEAVAPLPVRRYDAVSMSLHWLTLLLLILLFASIWMREAASDRDMAALLLTVHRSTGSLLWLVTLARLVWKVAAARAPALPASVPTPQRWAARANEYALYLLLVAQPVTGFVQSIARGKAFPLFGIEVPPVMARDKALAHLFHDIHEASATILLVLIGLHTAAALIHCLVLRDGVLSSMLPGRSGAPRK